MTPLAEVNRMLRLICADVAVLWQGIVFHNLIGGILLLPGHKVYALLRPTIEQRVVIVTTIHRNDAAGRQDELARDVDLMNSALRYDSKTRQVSVMIEEQMELDSPLGLPELGSGEQAQTQVDRRRVKTEQRALEAELALLAGALAVTGGQ